MSPQLMWTLAGLVLTVLTLGGVTLSSAQSFDASEGKMVAAETGNIATAAKLWLANNSSDGTFTGITPFAMAKYIPDMKAADDGAALNAAGDLFASKASSGVTFNLAAGANTAQVVITVDKIGFDAHAVVKKSLTGKACDMAEVTAATAGNSDGKVSYTCNG